jgi:glycosyltransferase involved in cell wall biosynthesis
LMIKCINGDQRPAEHEMLVADADTHANVHVLEGYLSPTKKNGLLASCDCYVSLHRAEGFGLTLAEAMYFGRPVIATGYSGNLDFMHDGNSHLIDYELTSIGSGAEPYPPDGEWAEPDLEQASRIMRHVFDNRAQSRELGAQAALDIRRTHSYAVAGATMQHRLAVIRTQGQERDRAAGESPRLEG